MSAAEQRPLHLADLPPETIAKLRTYKYDRIIEKHEGPERWASELPDLAPGGENDHPDPADFLRVADRDVLLPVGRSQHPNITVSRVIVGDDGESLTIFLKDTTYVEKAEDEFFAAGFLAVCDRVPGEPFYVAHVYHEWFMMPRIANAPRR